MPLRGKVRAAPQASIQCRAFCCFICFHRPVYAAYSPSCNSFTYAAAHGCVREPNIPSRIPAGTQYRSWKFRFFRFSGRRTDGLWAVGGTRLGRCAAPKVQRPVPFPFAHRPSIPSHIPKTYGWTSGARLRPHPPLHLPPAAVCPHGRLIQTETQHTRPLLMGLGRVNTEPTALAAGTAGLHPLKSPDPWESPFLETPPFFPPSPRPPERRRRQAPARGPAAVYALCRRNRNETKQVRPPARGADLRDQRAKGTGRRHCRPAPTQESKPLGIPFSGNASVPPISPSPKTPQADGPCSWAVRRLPARSLHLDRNAAHPPPARGAGVRLLRANGTVSRHCRRRGGAWRGWRGWRSGRILPGVGWNP